MTDILKGLQVLVVANIFILGNLKDCLMKILHLLLQLVISLLQNYFGTKTRVEFNANCLRQDKITSNHRKMLNLYTVFEISKKNCISSYPTLENYLFGAFTVNEKC